MIIRRAILLALLLELSAGVLDASTLVIRDSIGPTSTLTDEMPGGAALHDGDVWFTPGLVVNAPEDGELVEARFVIFARTDVGDALNDLATIYGFPMEFHIWSDGIEGGADSFDENTLGVQVPGHIEREVNSPFFSFITVVPFGHTGPPDEPTKFTTFLVTIDLSSFNLALQGGTEYVMSIIQDNSSNFVTPHALFRISASRVSGFEDVFRADTTENIRPGYVNSQLGFGYEQFGGSFTLTSFDPGDFNRDGTIDALDIDLLASAAHNDADNLLYDLNEDGAVTFAVGQPDAENPSDSDVLIYDILDTRYGDADLNGQVFLSDLTKLAINYRQAGQFGWADGNFNGSQEAGTTANPRVFLSDLTILATNWRFGVGSGAALESIPEPSGFVLALCSVFAALNRRVRFNALLGD
jgi:hypothetical protein